jgi:hypothetical protein
VKRIQFAGIERPSTLQVRNNREQLIREIVDATSEPDKKKLAKLLAIRSRELQWSDTDLHGLLAKRNDPSIRNYTKFVWWSIKTKCKPKSP